MFTVTGTIDTIPYRVGVHDEPIETELHGCVMGSDNATSFLTLHEGKTMQATPTHEPIVLSLANPASILAALRQHTQIINIEGDEPVPVKPDGSDAIY